MSVSAPEFEKLEELATLSRRYGQDKDFTISGGGNSSFKTQDRIWVKPSGSFLSNMTAEGFVELERAKVRRLLFNTYSTNPAKRESKVKDDLMACRVDPQSSLRPSVETSLHEAIEYDFVVHLHPYVVNALLCSQDARNKAQELFGNDMLYVEYVDPGYVLSKRVFQELQIYRQQKGRDPRVVLLENHGIFVGADCIEDIRAAYGRVMDTISRCFKQHVSTREQELPEQSAAVVASLKKIRADAHTRACRSPLISHFFAAELVHKVLTPLTPDQIVYCAAYPLYLESYEGFDQLLERHQAYQAEHGFLPKVLLVRDIGVFAIGNSEKGAELVADVFEDWMKISYYSENFGGPHFLTREEIDFIAQWEAESYRLKMARD